MECVKTVAEPNWVFGEQGRDGAMKMTFMFFPERVVKKLPPEITDALTRLPAELTVLAIEKRQRFCSMRTGACCRSVFSQHLARARPFNAWEW